MRTSSSWRVWRKLTSIIGRSKKILGTKSRPPYDPGTWLCSCMTCADNLEWAGESLPALKGWFYTEKSCYQFPSFFLSIQVQLCAFYRDFLCLGHQVKCLWVHFGHQLCSLGFLPSHWLGCVEMSERWSCCCIFLFCSWMMAGEGVKCWCAIGCCWEAAVPRLFPSSSSSSNCSSHYLPSRSVISHCSNKLFPVYPAGNYCKSRGRRKLHIRGFFTKLCIFSPVQKW